MRVDSSAETGVGSLRRRFMYAALRAASVVASKFDDARIIHLSMQRTHVHMIVAMRGWRVDPFSTGFKFDGWRE